MTNVPGSQPDPRTVLYAGCGGPATRARTLHWSFRNWQVIYLDVDPRCEPDVVASITDMRVVPSDSVDAVFAAHVLEHVAFHEVPVALKEMLRVLRPDGDLLLQLPDLTTACQAIAEGRPEQALYQSPGGAIAPLDMLYGHRPGVARVGGTMAHRSGFTAATLTTALEAAGFLESVSWVEGYDLWATAQKATAQTPGEGRHE